MCCTTWHSQSDLIHQSTLRHTHTHTSIEEEVPLPFHLPPDLTPSLTLLLALSANCLFRRHYHHFYSLSGILVIRKFSSLRQLLLLAVVFFVFRSFSSGRQASLKQLSPTLLCKDAVFFFLQEEKETLSRRWRSTYVVVVVVVWHAFSGHFVLFVFLLLLALLSFFFPFFFFTCHRLCSYIRRTSTLLYDGSGGDDLRVMTP